MLTWIILALPTCLHKYSLHKYSPNLNYRFIMFFCFVFCQLFSKEFSEKRCSFYSYFKLFISSLQLGYDWWAGQGKQ